MLAALLQEAAAVHALGLATIVRDSMFH